MTSIQGKIASLLLVLSALGCAPSIQSAAKEATKGAAPEAVSGGIQALDEQETRARIADLMSSPEVQKAIQSLAGAATDGVTNALTNAQMAERTAQLANGIAALATRAAVDAALQQTTSAANQRRLEQMASAAADSAVRSALRAFAEELPKSVGPALSDSVRKDIAPSVQAALNAPELKGALAQSAYEVARQVVLGSNAGLAELEQRNTKTGTLARLTGWLANGGWFLAGAALLVMGTTAAIVILFWRTRRPRREVATTR